MEEILASIRRIIADDHAAPPQAAAEPLMPVSPPEIAPEPPLIAEAPAELTRDYEAERVEGWTDIPAASKATPTEPHRRCAAVSILSRPRISSAVGAHARR